MINYVYNVLRGCLIKFYIISIKLCSIIVLCAVMPVSSDSDIRVKCVASAVGKIVLFGSLFCFLIIKLFCQTLLSRLSAINYCFGWNKFVRYCTLSSFISYYLSPSLRLSEVLPPYYIGN